MIPLETTCIRITRRFARLHPRLSPTHFRPFLLHRTFATHKGAATASTTPLLSQALDQKARSARRDDSVGPFRLGLIPPTPQEVGNIKKWSELNRAEKGASTNSYDAFFKTITHRSSSRKDNSPHIQSHRHPIWRRSLCSVGLCSHIRNVLQKFAYCPVRSGV